MRGFWAVRAAPSRQFTQFTDRRLSCAAGKKACAYARPALSRGGALIIN